MVDLLALAGFDFAIVDMEHGQITEPDAHAVIRACRAAGLWAVIRLPDALPGVVNRLLEVGAVGIQMPKVRSGDDAMRLVSMLRFPPDGVRSIGFANAWARYGEIGVENVVEDADARAVAIGMLETRDVELPIDAVLEPLDVAFIGPSDLAIEFGLPGDDPAVRGHIEMIEKASRRTQTVLGYPAKSPKQALDLIARGYRYIALSNDVAMLSGAARELINAVKSEKTDRVSGG